MAPDLKSLRMAIKASCLERSRSLLSLVDRSPYSPTYGCFDRSFWQYKIKDFPSGMSQEALYPLALALDADLFPGITEDGCTEIKQLLSAAATLSLRQQHRNGSVDDYFPFEQAAGATAFSLFAILATIEAGHLRLSHQDNALLQRRLNWLASHHESGRLSNHEALISLVLAMASSYFHDSVWLKMSAQRCQRLIGWRSAEGWFEEYGGFDVGYETLTFSCLLELSKRLPAQADGLAVILQKQAEVILGTLEPDGCFGGELFSRGTWNCFAHGLLAYALDGHSQLLAPVIQLLHARFVDYPIVVRDDYVIQHHLWSDLLCLRLLACVPNQSTWRGEPMPHHQRALPESGHFWIQHGDLITHVSTRLGGAFRVYRQGAFVVQDTQFALQVRGPRLQTWMANAQLSAVRWHWQSPTVLVVDGPLTAYKAQLMTSAKLILLRFIMFLGGRFWPDAIRRAMQRMLIYCQPDMRRRFARQFEFKESRLVVSDAYFLPESELAATELINTSSSGFRHVVMSRMFHPYDLLRKSPLRDRRQCSGEALIVEREW